MRRFSILALPALALIFACHSAAPAKCICSNEKRPTLRKNLGDAKFVLYGRFADPQKFTGAVESPTTEFIVEKVLKGGPFKAKTITLYRYVPVPDPKNPQKFVVFFDVFKGEFDAYRGIEVKKGSKFIAYLKGVAAVKDSPIGERLLFYFKHLNHPESEIASDALREFELADYKDYRGLARKLPAETLAKWLQDPKTPPQRLGLYARLLGQCGKVEHGQILRKIIENPKRPKEADVGDLLFGYVSLQPKEGWKLISALFKDKNQEFVLRYAGVRAARTLWENRPDLVSKEDLVTGMALLLDESDIADFAIEDLRKWNRWELTDRILALFNNKSPNVVKRAILRFALQSPSPSAANFVEAQRSRDPDWVSDAEELLRLE